MGLLPASRILRVVAGRLVAAWLPVAVLAAEPAAVDAELACTAVSQVH